MHKKVIALIILMVALLGVVLFFQLKKNDTSSVAATSDTVFSNTPQGLRQQFPNTSFENSEPKLTNAISGGPKKDGIPALDNPKFIPIAEFSGSGDMNVIVIERGNETKVYPYNILTWHEIVNDMVGGEPLAITFCPLCGSALVFDRTLPDGTITTFGVSGFLLESNMIMFDRTTETLWQQSTGKALAGTHFSKTLSRAPFQLLTLVDAKRNYPNATIVSEDTGHRRDYKRNPYSGYETNNQFVFEPSNIDSSLPPKTIMAVFYHEESPVAIPWLKLREQGSTTITVGGTMYSLQVTEAGELGVTQSDTNKTTPFYFEMWFSAAAQHGDELTLITL